MDNKGDKFSYKRKKEIFLLHRCSNNLKLKIYYKRCCAVLSKVILTAQKNYIITKSFMVLRTKWKIINEEKGKTKSGIDIQSLVINNNVIINQNKIANIFNNSFISIANTVNSDNNKHVNKSMTNTINYLTNNFRRPFPNIS